MGRYARKYTWRGRLIQVLGYLISWLATVQATLITADAVSKRK